MNRLKEVREATGRSVAGLARLSGLSRQAIYGLEGGKSEGTLDTWLRLASALDTDVEELSGNTYESLRMYASGKAHAPGVRTGAL